MKRHEMAACLSVCTAVPGNGRIGGVGHGVANDVGGVRLTVDGDEAAIKR